MFASYGKCRRPQHRRCLRGTWGEPYRICLVWEFDGAHNTVREMSAPTTLLGFCYVREVVGYCPTGVQGIILGIAVDLGALPCFLHLFPGSYRAGVPGQLGSSRL